MRILFIDGDSDYDAMEFERRFENLEEVARNVELRGGRVEYEDAGGEFAATVSVIEFGDVDIAFVNFVIDNYIDYDMSKMRNFHVLKEGNERRMLKDMDDGGNTIYKEDAE